MYGQISKSELGWLVLLLAAGMILPAFANNYQLYIGNVLLTYVVLAIGLDLVMGQAGQFALSHIAFYGIGAYGTSYLQQKHGIPFPIGLVVSIAISCVLAWLVARASVRLRHIYLGLATVAFAAAAHWLFQHWTGLTGGFDGVRIEASDFWLFVSHTDASNFRVLVAITVLIYAATFLLLRSRLGRSMAAIRDSEHVAAVSGINVNATKAWVLVISSAYACIGGGMLVIFTSFIEPRNFDFAPAVVLLTMLVVGGMGSVAGVTIGAIVMGLLPEVLRMALGDHIVWQEFVYGLILVASIVLMPAGAWGALRNLRTRLGGTK